MASTRAYMALGVALLWIATLAGCAADGAGANQPPILEVDVQSELTYTVGEGVIRITLTAEDPEGGPIKFEVVDGPDRAELQTSSNWAIFIWDPLGPDVTPADEPRSLVFAAIDNEGARTERVVSVRIQAGNGIPRFLNSSSILHSISDNKPVAFDVTIRDDDSDSVNLRMPPGFAPEGAELTSTGPLSGRFGWQPRTDQLQQRVHTVKFIADDGINDPVEQDVTIILKKETSKANDVQNIEPTDCFFEDRVTYSPLKSQRGTEDYVVTASLTPLGAETVDKLVLNYTNKDAYNDFELEWESVEMVADGDNFVGTIPNPLLEEFSQEYYFEICAVDEDTDTENYRAVICGPTSLYESFIVYPPNVTECYDDPASGRSLEFPASVPENEFAYRRLCEEDEDFFEVPLGTNQKGFVYIVYPEGRRPTIEVFDQDQSLDVAPEHSECSGFTTINVENRGAPTRKIVRVAASDTAIDMPYQVLIDVTNIDSMTTCGDAEYEPNDDVDDATPITTQSAQFSGLEICRSDDVDLFTIDVTAGQEINITASFTHDIGDIDMILFAPSERDVVDTDPFGSDSSFGVEDEETIQHIAEESGTYIIRVYSEDNPNRYSLTVAVGEPAPSCIDTDGDNHAQNRASILPLGTTNSLEICAATEDWYSFFVIDPVFESFIIELTPAMAADLNGFEIEVWDVFGKVSDGTVSNGKLKIDFFPFDFGDHYIRVKSSGDADYGLTLTLLTSV